MPFLSSVEDQLLAANKLLVAVNQTRDFASNELAETNSPIAQWLDRYELSFLGTSSCGDSNLNRLQHLISTLDEASQGRSKQATGISELNNALEMAVRAEVERFRIESAIAHRVKQAIYDFAYGLSHEINNPLANISARAQQLMIEISDERSRKSLATIVDQCMRAYEMLAEMMLAVKPRTLEISPVDIQSVLSDVCHSLETLTNSSQIKLDLQTNAQPIYVLGHAGELAECLESLIKNAFDASAPNSTIQIRIVKPNGGPRYAHSEQVSKKEYLELQIYDSGRGLSAVEAESAFNLYYSGREHGKGLGISLAKAKRAIEGSGGTLELRSSPGLGTITTVRLLTTATPRPAPTLKSRLFHP